MSWNFAAALDALGTSAIAARPALLDGDRVVDFATLRLRAHAIAGWLTTLELPRGAHVGHYLRNSPAYIEMFVAAGLAGLAHVNVNFRYVDDELVQLCNDLDIRVLVYERDFAPRIAAVRARLRTTVAFVEAGGERPLNEFAVGLESLHAHPQMVPPARCSGDDLVVIATGGTTGLPKGTLWRQEDLWRKLNVSRGGSLQALQLPEHPADLAGHVTNVEGLPPAAPYLVLSPLMHGAGLMMALIMLGRGSPLLTIGAARFDPDAPLEAIRRHRVGGMALVGDAFALPLLEALDRRPADGLIDSLGSIVSTGAALSAHVKAGLQRHNPRLQIVDTLGSTEASGFAFSTPEPGVFKPMPGTRVLDDTLRDLDPGSTATGMIYACGYLPLGYYNDAERSAATFPMIDGQRYAKTGDRCLVRDDGMLVLLGRDSSVINTGGEKVYTVEVERALLENPAVRDALVIGLPHPRFGSQVIAVLESEALAARPSLEDEIKANLRGRLADYKVPRRLLAIPSLRRAANGKPDYPFVTRWASEMLAVADTPDPCN